MSVRVHGIISAALVGIAVTVAVVVLFDISMVLGVIYLALSAAGMVGVIYAFCAKCPGKAHCAHVLPGLIARRMSRPAGPYTGVELAAVVVGVGLLVGFPLFWLWRSVAGLIAFVALNAVAVWEITRFVCCTCDNVHCLVKTGGTQ